MKTPLFVTVLVWMALGTLMMAIAKELSMEKITLGAEGFVAGPLHPIVQTRVSLSRTESAIPEQKGVLPEGSSDEMVMYRGQTQMTGLGKYLGYDKASEDYTRPAEKQRELSGESPDLGDRRKPYQLLADAIPAVELSQRKPNTKETAQRCFESDFEAQTQKVRNFTQRTNNYKRDGPDSCSAPTRELVGNFYKAKELPPANA